MKRETSTRPFRVHICERFGAAESMFVIALLLWFSGSRALTQATAPPTQREVESAYLFNFGKFVGWPARPDAGSQRFTICTIGKDEFGNTLDSLILNESIQGRKITTRRLASVTGADTCDMVYIGMSEKDRLTADLDALKDKPVLTVSGLPGFLEHGGIIQFLLLDNRVRFAVNITSATQSHLALSSELLKVAVYVNPKSSEVAQ